MSLVDTAQILPYVSIGVGYTFVLDTLSQQQRIDVATPEDADAPQVACQSTPDEASLERSVNQEVQNFADKLRATYAGSYSNGEYDVDITSMSINGTSASVRANYSGSAREILSGNRISASGTIRARFRWNGCGWTLEDYSHN